MLTTLRTLVTALAVFGLPVFSWADSLKGATLQPWKIAFDDRHVHSGIYVQNEPGELKIVVEGATLKPPKIGVFDSRGSQVAELDPKTGEGNQFSYGLPTHILGYFEIRPLESEPENLIPAAGSRPPGFISFCVVRAPRENASSNFTDAFAGIQGTTRLPGGGQEGWQLYPLLGISSVQTGVYGWSRTEPKLESSAVDFEAAMAKDIFPKFYKTYQFVPVFTIDTMPVWAVTLSEASQKLRPGSPFGLPPNDIEGFKAYLRKLIPILIEKYNYLPYRIYQISWEPNDKWGWFGDDESLIVIYKAAREVISAIDPQSKLAGPTIAGLGAEEVSNFDRLMAVGVGKYIDVVACHLYPSDILNYDDLRLGLKHMMQVIEESAGRPLPIIDTESGHDASAMRDPPTILKRHAYAYATQALIKKGFGLSMHTYFYLTDGGPGNYGLLFNLRPDKHVGPDKVSPKPDFPMVRQVNDVISNSDAVGFLDFTGRNANIQAYAFKKRDSRDTILAIWDPTGRDREVSIAVAAESVSVEDEFGNSRTLAAEEGRLSVKLSQAPTYIKNFDESALAHFALPPQL